MKATLIKIGKFIGTWVPTAMLIFVFTMQGIAKFSATSGWARAFAHWGYPDWFRYTVGVLEILAGVLLVLPMTAAAGAMLVMGVMIGAYATHIVGDGSWDPRHELMPFLFATLVFFVRRHKLAQLIQRLRGKAPPT